MLDLESFRGGQENIPPTKDVGYLDTRTLPPKVVSNNKRGFLELSVDSVQWRLNGYQQGEARIIWWGENCQDAATIKIPASNKKRLKYAICTSGALFRKYLSGCEAIEVQFHSSGRQIGTSLIPIPEDLLQTGFTDAYKICSLKKLSLGTLTVSLKLVMFEDFEKNIPLSAKNRISPFVDKTYSSGKSTSKIWRFLKGEPMDYCDEVDTLREICRSSPANSTIECIDHDLMLKLRSFNRRTHLKCHTPGNTDDAQSTAKQNITVPNSERSNLSTGTISNGLGSDSAEKKEHNSVEVSKQDCPEECIEYQCLFYVGSYRHASHQRLPNVFVISKSLSSVDESLSKSNLSDSDLYVNFLRISPTLIDATHLERTMKNNTLNVEVWARDATGDDLKVGFASIGLHQFFVAFREAIVRNRLQDLSLPVIAIDGWAEVQLNDQKSQGGQLELIVAMGTKAQIEYLTRTKSLLNRPPPENTPRNQPSFNLRTLLDNLSQQNSAAQVSGSKGEVKSTSHVFDMLQKALVNPPQSSTGLDLGAIFGGVSMQQPEQVEGDATKDFFAVSLDIESAMHLPRVGVASRAGNKKGKAKSKKGAGEVDPSCYATFEAKKSTGKVLIQSVEGLVYATNVVERSCNPVWNSSFHVELPKDLLTNNEKSFVVKVWRKAIQDNAPKTMRSTEATPIKDVLIGFCTINLNVLATGLPEIAGWYNIVDFDGKSNGQLQIRMKPIEEIPQRKALDVAGSSGGSGRVAAVEQTADPTSFDMDDFGSALSRALKRKFTELDEISQRLKTRLRDVTTAGDMDFDEEFDTCLNTNVEESDTRDDFDWAAAMAAQLESLNKAQSHQNKTDDGVTSMQTGNSDSSAGANLI